jgi:AcrR family transcriptional regulator
MRAPPAGQDEVRLALETQNTLMVSPVFMPMRNQPAQSIRPEPGPAAAPARILHHARARFFAHGYSSITMDELAADLGMSKKTLYVHFAGKDEIVAAIIDDVAAEIRADADALLADRRLTFAEKLRRFAGGMSDRLARLQPRTLRDLQRCAPGLYRRLEEVREKSIPHVFGRMVQEGQARGMVRTDLPAGFALEFFLHAVQGVLQPDVLDRLGLAPRQAIASSVDLFFRGLLTPAGRKQYEGCLQR